VSVKVKARVEGLEETIRILKQVEPEAVKTMRKEIRSVVTGAGAISAVRMRTPSIAPMSGMEHQGQTRWGGVKSVTTSVSLRTVERKRGQRSYPIVKIVASNKDALGFEYAELAGIRRRLARARSKIPNTGLRGTAKGDGSIALNGQGDNFIKVLQERIGKAPGRFAFAAVFSKRRQIEQGSQQVLDKYAEKVNRKLQ
jgi:hypothetical protein